VAGATRQLLEMSAPTGLYHCVNSGVTTWLEFAEQMARLLGIDARLDAVHLADMNLRAARPVYCALSNAKLCALGIEMPSWQDALARYLTGLRSDG
jgi:dTDP-4-dehydrorhamnose reductase